MPFPTRVRHPHGSPCTPRWQPLARPGQCSNRTGHRHCNLPRANQPLAAPKVQRILPGESVWTVCQLAPALSFPETSSSPSAPGGGGHEEPQSSTCEETGARDSGNGLAEEPVLVGELELARFLAKTAADGSASSHGGASRERRDDKGKAPSMGIATVTRRRSSTKSCAI